MNRVHGVWALGASAEGEGPSTQAEVIEATLSWRDTRGATVLAVTHVRAGETLTIGDEGRLLVPTAVLGQERFEVLRFEGGRALAAIPAGAALHVDGVPREACELEVCRGHVVELYVGAFVLRLVRAPAESRMPRTPLAGLRRAGAGVLLGSALAHAAAFAVLAYVSPALGSTEDDGYDSDRLALMQKLLNASAARELEPPPQDGSTSNAGGNTAPGAQAAGAEGAAGKDTPRADGRWAARGTAPREQATLPRERDLEAAKTWGIIGMLPTSLGDPDAPTVTWGTTLEGADDVNKVGHLFGGSLADAMGAGGWGLLGTGEGGGGRAGAIGLGNGLGGLGTGSCFGDAPCSGIGAGRGKVGTPHVSLFRGPRYGVPQSSGHLPAEVIQRIVRQNDGRYRFCYQQGLRTNPNLEGRVTVKFLISRDGSVGYAADGGSDIPDSAVRQCVVSSFTGLSFPSPESGVVTVFYPIVFNPQ